MILVRKKLFPSLYNLIVSFWWINPFYHKPRCPQCWRQKTVCRYLDLPPQTFSEEQCRCYWSMQNIIFHIKFFILWTASAISIDLLNHVLSIRSRVWPIPIYWYLYRYIGIGMETFQTDTDSWRLIHTDTDISVCYWYIGMLPILSNSSQILH